jgi:hypothetical protein
MRIEQARAQLGPASAGNHAAYLGPPSRSATAAPSSALGPGGLGAWNLLDCVEEAMRPQLQLSRSSPSSSRPVVCLRLSVTFCRVHISNMTGARGQEPPVQLAPTP